MTRPPLSRLSPVPAATEPQGFGVLVELHRHMYRLREKAEAVQLTNPTQYNVYVTDHAEYERQAEAYARQLAAQDSEPHPWHELQARAAMLAARPPESGPAPASSHCAFCPVGGCGRELPIDPSQADRSYTCPCPKQAELHVGRTEERWTLRLPPSLQEQRETINRIAYALHTGQGYTESRRSPTLTAADANSARMTEAFQTSHALALQAVHAVLAGHGMQAYDLARRAHAADLAYRTHERRYRLARKEYRQQGRWHDTETFWIEQPDPYTPGHPLRRYTFNLVALWDERGATVEVVNGPEIALRSGMDVDAEAWRQLVALLTRIETKPGAKVDPQELVYMSVEERVKVKVAGREQERIKQRLRLRPYVQKNFPKAEKALEALRRSLIVEITL